MNLNIRYISKYYLVSALYTVPIFRMRQKTKSFNDESSIKRAFSREYSGTSGIRPPDITPPLHYLTMFFFFFFFLTKNAFSY